MGDPTWNDTIRTGLDWQDAQHQRLLDSLDQLENSLREGTQADTVQETLDFLDEYCSSHFHDEEMRMERYGYPDLTEHQHQHELFMHARADFAQRLRDDKSMGKILLADDLRVQLTEWFIQHILDVDRKLARFLIEHGHEN